MFREVKLEQPTQSDAWDYPTQRAREYPQQEPMSKMAEVNERNCSTVTYIIGIRGIAYQWYLI